MELNQIRYFVAMCRLLNFTRAAEACGVTQPALTRGIRGLEQEFGGPLFHRERARTHLTELGRLVEPYLHRIDEQSASAKAGAAAYHRLEGARLRLGVMCTIAPHFLVGVLNAITASKTGLQVEIEDGPADRLETRLLEGHLDITLAASATAAPDPRLMFTPIARDQMVVVVSDTHALANRAAIRILDLDKQRYVERANCEFNGRIGAEFDALGLSDTTVCRVDRDDWVLAMVAAGMGYSFMPESCVSESDLLRIPFDPPLHRDLAVVTVRGRRHGPALGVFLREALRSARQTAPSANR